MVLEVYLIRHGETDFNKAKEGFKQAKNMSLNSTGRLQASLLRDSLKNISFDYIFSSNLLRTQETTNIIFNKYTIRFDTRLREYKHGKYNPDSDEWKNEYRRLMNTGLKKEDIRPFGGENIWDVIKRVKEFIEEISLLDGRVAVVSHSATLKIFINLISGFEKKDFQDFRIDNTGVTKLVFQNNKWTVKEVNNLDHLSQIDSR